MNIYQTFEAQIVETLQKLESQGQLPTGLPFERAVVEPPRDASHGDLASNAAMVLAKPAGLNPRALALMIVQDLQSDPRIAGLDIAGPGFLNITLKPSILDDVVRDVLKSGPDYGKGAPQQNKVNVEYVSANPTGPMHVGHGRGAVFGDALANLLQFSGFEVSREYYINDAGAQVDVLARSAFLRYREALGETIIIPEGLYPGDYLKNIGESLKQSHGPALLSQPEQQWLPVVRDAAIDGMMAMIRNDLAALDISHDVFFSERSLSQGETDQISETIADLRARDLIYEGRLPPPKGQIPEDWEDREQTLFRATGFGDDVDRPLLKSDGSYTYFAADIAYHRSKFNRGFTTLIDVWGADHGGYVKRMQASVKAITHDQAHLDVKLCQLVRLLRAGEPVKMSKRSGDFVTLREVVDEVGRDAVRFMMLFRKNDATLDFDLAKVVEQSKDNPVFYVQYAHARCSSVLRQAQEAYPHFDLSSQGLQTAHFDLLTDDAERSLMRMMAQYPRMIEASSLAHEPHRVAFYLYDLASHFHHLWNKGKDLPQLRFVNLNDPKLTYARLGFIEALRHILVSGLGLLGVSAPQEMR